MGQIPTYEKGDFALCETGTIVFHLAQRHAGLLPDDENARGRTVTSVFVALNTVEPPILERETTGLLEGHKTRYEERLPPNFRRLSDSDGLDGAFSAGDLLIVSCSSG